MSDLLNLEWFSGDINSRIAPLFQLLGTGASWVISIVGFAIVWSSILKNSSAGLYAVNTKFWDRVDEVKKAKLLGQNPINSEAAQRLNNGSSNEVMQVLGSVGAVLLSFMPNVKAMTDFENETLDVKSYFMKAIPMMCVAIFVGIFIWLGYPARIAGKFGDFSTSAIDMVLINVDPVAWVETVPEKLAVLKFPQTDGAKDDVSKYENKIASAAANKVVGAITAKGDMTKESKLATAAAIESWVIESCEGGGTPFADYCDSDKYKFSVSAAVSYTGARDISRVHNVVNSDGVATFALQKAISDFPTGTTVDISQWYITCFLEFTPKALRETKSTYECEMTVPNSMAANAGNGSKTFTVSETGNGKLVVGDRKTCSAVVNGQEVTCSINHASGSSSFSIVGSTVSDLSGVMEFTGITGMYYEVNGTKHKVKTIKIGGGEVSFQAIGDSSVSWKFGDDPQTAGQ